MVSQRKKTLATTRILVPEHGEHGTIHLDVTCKRGEAELIDPGSLGTRVTCTSGSHGSVASNGWKGRGMGTKSLEFSFLFVPYSKSVLGDLGDIRCSRQRYVD